MAEPDRWVVVDTHTGTIVGGPYLWDGAADWRPSEEGRLVREVDAIADGFTYPPVTEEAP